MTPKFVILGATGYIGQAFEKELERRGDSYIALSRSKTDYSKFETLLQFLKETRPEFLINAAGYTGKPNVDACETARAETLQGNSLFPQTVAHACAAANIPWGHVSSGCIYSGAHLVNNGSSRVEPDLQAPQVKNEWEANPGILKGFSEVDEPNFSFRRPPCSFYSGTKALGEEAIHNVGQTYIWRLRIPFDEFDNSRNYLSKVQRYPRAYENVNSLSHRTDFVSACLKLWDLRAPFGIYNVTNPGWVTTKQVTEMLNRLSPQKRTYDFFKNDEEFYRTAAKAPRSNCIMDVTKLLNAGVPMRPVEEALEHAIKNWLPEKP